MMVRVEYGVFATPGPVLVVDVGSDGLTVQLPTCRPRVKYDEVVRVVPAVCLTAGAVPPPLPPVCSPAQQEPTLECGGRRPGDEERAKGNAGPANTPNPHQGGASTRLQAASDASRCSDGVLGGGRPTAGGSSGGSVSGSAATNEVQAGRGAARVGWGEERVRGTPRSKRKRAATVAHGREEAASHSGQHVRSDQTQIDTARPSLISACVAGGSGVGAQGSACGRAGGEEGGSGGGAPSVVVLARGRGDPEARVTLASSKVCIQSDCES